MCRLGKVCNHGEVPTIPDLHDLTWQQYAAAGVVALAALALLTFTARAGIRAIRRTGAVNTATAAAATIALGSTIEGAILLATRNLNQHGIWAAIPAVLFESVWIAVAGLAFEHKRTHGHPGPYRAWLWRIGVVAGLVVALSGNNPAEVAFRLVAPLAGTLLLDLRLNPAGIKRAKETVTLLWTPRRLLVRWGVLAPEDRDVAGTHRAYQTRRIVQAAYKAWTLRQGNADPGKLAKAQAKLRRLSLVADADVLADAAIQIEQTSNVVDQLDPATIAATRQLHADNEALREAVHEATATATALRVEVRKLQEANVATDAQLTATRQRLDQAEAEVEALRRSATRTGNPAPRRAATRPGNPPADLPAVDKVAPATVAKVWRAWTANPDATTPEIAGKAGVSPRTAGTVIRALRAWQNDREPASDPEDAPTTAISA